MEQRTAWLTAPSLQNSSCNHPRYSNVRSMSHLTVSDVAQASIVLLLSLGILVANILVIIVINSRRYSKLIHSQPRYLLTSLASNDLAIGLMVTPFGFLPALYRCWPYGELFCQIQALLRGALCQQSAVILICMAIDRYMCMLHPVSYHKRSSKKGCVAVISLTWITTLSLFAVMVLPRGGYYFNQTGLLACDPFFARVSLRILSSCLFYFPTTMILMYCYGSAFHVNKLRLRKVTKAGSFSPSSTQFPAAEKFVVHERKMSLNVSRTMAAMSLGFIVMVTPWTIQEVVAACTGSKVPPFLDFLVTWIALSNSFWNPFLYWLLNNEFRKISKQLILSKFFCRKNRKFNHQSRCCSTSSTGAVPPPPVTPTRTDLEGLSEKYWGEILERTVSSNSLQAMQRLCPPPPPIPPPPPPLSYSKHNEILLKELNMYNKGTLSISDGDIDETVDTTVNENYSNTTEHIGVRQCELSLSSLYAPSLFSLLIASWTIDYKATPFHIS